jgi:carboxymethylenebutenolidase
VRRGLAGLLGVFVLAGAAGGASSPETVRFPSADGKTSLVGYLFAPGGLGPHAAVVLLHGRSGPCCRSGLGIGVVIDDRDR